MGGQHALFAPSSAHRISTCPASLLFTKDMPDSPSFEAVEGTVAHAIHEFVANAAFGEETKRMDAFSFVGMTAAEVLDDDYDPVELALVKDLVVDEAMAGYVQDSVDWCLEIEGHHYVEVRVDISKYTPVENQFGTCDHAVITKGDFFYEDDTLILTDLKYGKGVQVFAEKNKQLIMYALGVIEMYRKQHNFEKVIIRVSQPRLDHKDVWNTTVEELEAIGAELRERFTLALEPDAPFGPEEHACKFCRAKPVCPALAEKAREAAMGWFEDLDAKEVKDPNPDGTWPLAAPAVNPLTPAQMAVVLENRKLLTDFLSAVEAHAMHLLMHNQEIPGFKLVEGRSLRKWVDDAFVVDFLKEKGFDEDRIYEERKIVSPAVAEKLLPKSERKALQSYYVKPKGKPTLTHEDDKREPYALTAAEMFDDADGGL